MAGTSLTTAEAAALLTERGITARDGGSVKPDTVKRWCQRGLIPARGIIFISKGKRERTRTRT